MQLLSERRKTEGGADDEETSSFATTVDGVADGASEESDTMNSDPAAAAVRSIPVSTLYSLATSSAVAGRRECWKLIFLHQPLQRCISSCCRCRKDLPQKGQSKVRLRPAGKPFLEGSRGRLQSWRSKESDSTTVLLEGDSQRRGK